MCKVSGLMSRRFSILFGARLRVVRISRGMGLDEFSALLGISKQDLRRYEWGRRCRALLLSGTSHRSWVFRCMSWLESCRRTPSDNRRKGIPYQKSTPQASSVLDGLGRFFYFGDM